MVGEFDPRRMNDTLAVVIAPHQGVFTAADEDGAGTAGASIGKRIAEPRPRTLPVAVAEGKRVIEKDGMIAGDTAVAHPPRAGHRPEG
ncbi:hypothetical protein [Embleya sp. NBC_00896]|uniref:hypothetical protein n=1 Tax=Embleya sp. NBC_00896 TaxID=2975961 RepID=UPI00386E9549|nr:hypothetical protein OG928_45400 [Embleya sp. NBC_00896]